MGCGTHNSGRADPFAQMVSCTSVQDVLLGADCAGSATGAGRIEARGAQSTAHPGARAVRHGPCAGGAPGASPESLLGGVLRDTRPRPETRRAIVAKGIEAA